MSRAIQSRIISNPADWHTYFRQEPYYIDPRVRHEMQDAVERALAAGAIPPLRYYGVGMVGFVFGDAKGRAFKVGSLHQIGHHMLAMEYEWLLAASRIGSIAQHIARPYAYFPDSNVLVREAIESKALGSGYPSRKLHALHRIIERTMIPYGWTAPEYKEDSYIITRGRGPVLVDASMPQRVGRNLAAHAAAVASGLDPYPERVVDVAFFVSREVREGTIPAHIGERLIRRLATRDPEAGKWSSPIKP